MSKEDAPINIFERLKKGQLDGAIQDLNIFFHENGEEYHGIYDTYVTISSNYKGIESKKIKNLISESEYSRERSKITDALIKVQRQVNEIRLEKKVKEIKAGYLAKNNNNQQKVNPISSKLNLYLYMFVGILLVFKLLGILPSEEKPISNQEVRHIVNKLIDKLALVDTIYTQLGLVSPTYGKVLFANQIGIEKSKSDISTKYRILPGDAKDFVDKLLIFSCYLTDAIIVSNTRQYPFATRNAIRSGIFNHQRAGQGETILSNKAMFFDVDKTAAKFFRQMPLKNNADSSLFEFEKKCLVDIGIENTLASNEGIENANPYYVFPESVSVAITYHLKKCKTDANCHTVETKYILVFDISNAIKDRYDIKIRTIYEKNLNIFPSDDFDCSQ